VSNLFGNLPVTFLGVSLQVLVYNAQGIFRGKRGFQIISYIDLSFNSNCPLDTSCRLKHLNELHIVRIAAALSDSPNWMFTAVGRCLHLALLRASVIATEPTVMKERA
jgi:hypothetical protein